MLEEHGLSTGGDKPALAERLQLWISLYKWVACAPLHTITAPQLTNLCSAFAAQTSTRAIRGH
jgi:hypothetical protein